MESAILAKKNNRVFPRKWSKVFFVVASPEIGVYASVMLWSSQIPKRITIKAEGIAQGQPYCLASNYQKIEKIPGLSGISLLRSRYYAGPGGGLEFSNLVAVLRSARGSNK